MQSADVLLHEITFRLLNLSQQRTDEMIALVDGYSIYEHSELKNELLKSLKDYKELFDEIPKMLIGSIEHIGYDYKQLLETKLIEIDRLILRQDDKLSELTLAAYAHLNDNIETIRSLLKPLWQDCKMAKNLSDDIRMIYFELKTMYGNGVNENNNRFNELKNSFEMKCREAKAAANYNWKKSIKKHRDDLLKALANGFQKMNDLPKEMETIFNEE